MNNLFFCMYFSYELIIKFSNAAHACDFDIIYDNQEYVKNKTYRFIRINKFDYRNKLCWNDLAEYYYNLAPANENTIIQNTFIFYSEKNIRISTISQFYSNRNYIKLIARGTADYKADAITFKRLL